MYAKRMVAALLCLFTLAACSGKAAAVPGQYINKDWGFTVVFPADWQVKEYRGGGGFEAAAQSPGEAPRFISVFAEPVPQGTTDAEYWDYTIERWRESMGDLTPVEAGEAKLAGAPARRTVFTFQAQDPPIPMTTGVYFLVRNGRSYMVIGQAGTPDFAAFRAQWEQAAATLEFR